MEWTGPRPSRGNTPSACYRMPRDAPPASTNAATLDMIRPIRTMSRLRTTIPSIHKGFPQASLRACGVALRFRWNPPLSRGRGPDHSVRPCRRHLPAAAPVARERPPLGVTTRVTKSTSVFDRTEVEACCTASPTRFGARPASRLGGAAISERSAPCRLDTQVGKTTWPRVVTS